MNSHSAPKGHAGPVVMDVIDRLYNKTPDFQDIFDQETFYAFAAAFTLLTAVAFFIASRYITIKARD